MRFIKALKSCHRAFGLLESVIALGIFSLVILIVSQGLLQITKDIKIYQDYHNTQAMLSNVSAYLQKQLQYAFVDFQNGIEIWSIHQGFFSPHYQPWAKAGKTIIYQGDVEFFINLSPNPRLLKVARKEGEIVYFYQEIEEGAMIPIAKKQSIVLKDNQDLIFDTRILAQGITEFKLQNKEGFYHLRLCVSLICQTSLFPKSEIFYAF